MRATKKPPQPNYAQAAWLKRIAQAGGMMKTRRFGESPAYDLLAEGGAVPPQTAEVLIRNGWVRGRGGGLLSESDHQIYKVLTP